MQSYEFFRCTCKEKDSQENSTIKCTLVYLSVTMQTPVATLHVQQHIWKFTHLSVRDPLLTGWNTTCNYQAFHLPAWEGCVEILGNFHRSTVMATWGSIFSNTTFALLAQKPLFNFPYTQFVTSLAILQQRAIPFTRGTDTWHHDAPWC